jgi:hypothetical protein
MTLFLCSLAHLLCPSLDLCFAPAGPCIHQDLGNACQTKASQNDDREWMQSRMPHLQKGAKRYHLCLRKCSQPVANNRRPSHLLKMSGLGDQVLPGFCKRSIHDLYHSILPQSSEHTYLTSSIIPLLPLLIPPHKPQPQKRYHAIRRAQHKQHQQIPRIIAQQITHSLSRRLSLIQIPQWCQILRKIRFR